MTRRPIEARLRLGRVGAAALLLVTAVVPGCGSGDERRIRRAVSEIQRLVAKTPAETDLAALATARKIALHFTDPLSVVAEPVGLETHDRRGLIAAIHQYRSRTSTLYMRVYDEELVLDQARRQARLAMTVEFVRDLKDLAGAEQYAVVLHWRRIDGDWLIESAEIRDRR